MNLLQCAPLCDSQGHVRYFIGAQIDVSGLAMEGAQMESLHELIEKQHEVDSDDARTETGEPEKDAFQELSELLSPRELITTQTTGGSLFNPAASHMATSRGHRSWIQPDTKMLDDEAEALYPKGPFLPGSLTGAYENVSLLTLLYVEPNVC